MSENVWAVPMEEPEEPGAGATVEQQFYVVSPAKLMTLAVLSLGFYFLFWAHRNWSLYRAATGEKVWPPARALFYIFFVHQLYHKAEASIRASGRVYAPKVEPWATLFVLLTVAVSLLDVVSRTVPSVAEFGAWALWVLPLRAYALSKSQGILNFAANDPAARSNSGFTLWNYLLIVPGVLLWFFILYGAYLLHRAGH
ncbi:hypothetical protein [Pseudomonas sp. dw_358]|uniref:hypothetical protein n=1 Tax=Pseudomonas sp. dw_358 TaxID=2720083 RepID=UPI001BD6145D|nr:hypothetical protein [Pseudomonas sp. dw_358]